jgi:hypothetical protein
MQLTCDEYLAEDGFNCETEEIEATKVCGWSWMDWGMGPM